MTRETDKRTHFHWKHLVPVKTHQPFSSPLKGVDPVTGPLNIQRPPDVWSVTQVEGAEGGGGNGRCVANTKRGRQPHRGCLKKRQALCVCVCVCVCVCFCVCLFVCKPAVCRVLKAKKHSSITLLLPNLLLSPHTGNNK